MRNIHFYLIIALLLFILLRQGCNSRRTFIKEKEKFSSIVSGLQNQVLQDGTLISKISAVNVKRKQAIELLEMTNDSLNNALANAIKSSGKGTQAVTVVRSETEYIDTGSIVIIVDSARCVNDTIVNYPVYYASSHDKWATWSVTAGPDSVVNKFKVYNQFALAWKKKKGKYECRIVNANPHTVTTGIKSWVIPAGADFWSDAGFVSGYRATSAYGSSSTFGGYGEIKYKLITAEVTAGIENNSTIVISPFVEAKLKVAIWRMSR